MAPQTGVIFYFQVLVVVHYRRRIAVIMTLGAAVHRGFALLDRRMTLPAGKRLIVAGLLLMTLAAIGAVNLLEFGVAEFIGLHLLAMTVFTGYRQSRAVERMMTDSAGIGHQRMRFMIKKHRSGGVVEVFPVSFRR